MSLGKKLFFGFGVVILIVIALGTIAHLLFRQIGSSMNALNTRSLPVVKLASGLQKSILEAVSTEKDFLLKQTSEKRSMVDEKLKSLDSLLQELESSAKQNGDSTMLTRNNEARKALDEHRVLYKQTVEALNGNTKQELVMDAKGAIVDEELDAFMEEKKGEYLMSKDGLALLNSIYALTLDISSREKSYMLDPGKEHINAVQINGTLALKQCEQLKKLQRSETEGKQVGLVKDAVQGHLNDFHAFVGEYQKDPESSEIAKLKDALSRSVDHATQIVEDYILVKQSAVEKVAQAVFMVRELNKEALNARVCEKSFIVTKESKYWDLLNEHILKLTEIYEKLRKTSSSPKDLQRIERSEQATKEYFAAAGSWMKIDKEVQEKILPSMYQNGQLVITAARAIEDDAWGKSDKASGQSLEVVGQSNIVISAALCVGVLVGLLLAWIISRSITRPIGRIIEGLSSSAGQVAAASNQISSTSEQLADGSSEQAAAIEETSSSLEEIASMTKQNALNASQCKAVMQEAKQLFQDVDGHMSSMVEAIEKISSSSEETQKIVKAIDEIAFQTNLLALNAAVEAARAGEAGAGFAVVADEVRNLAMRAADAAKTTSDLIEKTLSTVRDGSGITKMTRDGFKRNVEIAHKVSGLVEEIAAATQEQSLGIDQVNKAVLDMQRVTQESSASAEESAAASKEMSAQAGQMKDFVSSLVSLTEGNGRRKQSLPVPGNERGAIPLPAAGQGRALIEG
jgi:methyl-accepting chemotaxis protein